MITDVWHLLIFHERYTNWNWGRLFPVLTCIRFLSSVNCFPTLVASGTYDGFPPMLTSISLLSSVMPFTTFMPTGSEGFFDDV